MNTKSTKPDTRRSLELALTRIQKGIPEVVATGHKLSIATVAKEAGVSNSTVHNRYPDIAEKIRKLVKSSHMELGESHSGLKESQRKLTKARKEIGQLRADLVKSQSINLRLLKENELLQKKIDEYS